MMTLYHCTRSARAQEVLGRGFCGVAGIYMSPKEGHGVWLLDQPLHAPAFGGPAEADTLLRVVLNLSEEDITAYEWVEEGKPYRQWLLPASLVDAYSAVTIEPSPAKPQHGHSFPRARALKAAAHQLPKLTELNTYDEVLRRFSWDSLWALFDGDRDRMNLAHECIDRHRDKGTAVSIKFADGHREQYDYAVLTDLSGRFANWLTTMGIVKGDRVAIVLDPGKAFYVSLFATIKRGAIAVPLFTLFGPEGLALRINDCRPRLILTQQRAETLSAQFPGITVVDVNDAFWAVLHAASPAYTPDTRAADLAVFQYTSGTTRALPEAVKHTHRSVVTLMIAALYGVGLHPGDRHLERIV
jgi:hypothetical protein